MATILTLIPWEAASWPNIWGYRSLCTCSPGATLLGLLVWSTVVWADAKARSTDASTAATELEDEDEDEEEDYRRY